MGPVRVDISPPVVNGSLDVGRGHDYVTVTWEESTFTDEESLVVAMEYSIGEWCGVCVCVCVCVCGKEREKQRQVER